MHFDRETDDLVRQTINLSCFRHTGSLTASVPLW